MTIRLPATPASAARVRHQLSADLVQAALPADLVDDVVLVATELVSNAIRHAEPLTDGGLVVTWSVTRSAAGPAVTIRVSDGGAPGRPHVRHASDHDTGGRGLALVAALAARWGVDDTGDTTTVWAELQP